jgi:hypothetical protein
MLATDQNPACFSRLASVPAHAAICSSVRAVRLDFARQVNKK